MKEQKDFWKPAPFDFEAVVARVDVDNLAGAYRHRAKKHGDSEKPLWKTEWVVMEQYHDTYDRAHFSRTELSTAFDLWDNRRKGAKQ
jgi:hypothetical protein